MSGIRENPENPDIGKQWQHFMICGYLADCEDWSDVDDLPTSTYDRATESCGESRSVRGRRECPVFE